MIELIILLFVVSIISGLARWATDQRYKRKFEQRIRDMECCGEDCCEHSNKKVRK